MSKEIYTEIKINAPVTKIWAVLTDFAHYSKWNPFVQSIKGTVSVGENIEVKITPPDSSSMVFKPKVLEFEENTSFKWLGHLFIPGIFDGEHRFECIDLGDGTTLFRHSEKFNGILVGLIWRMIEKNTRLGFESMNTALKDKVEKIH